MQRGNYNGVGHFEMAIYNGVGHFEVAIYNGVGQLEFFKMW